MSKEQIIQAVLEYLKTKDKLTDLEEDILSTLSKYMESPFNRKSVEQKIIENNNKYQDIFAAIGMMPNKIVMPIGLISDKQLIENLKLQIEGMCFKEYNSMSNNLNP